MCNYCTFIFSIFQKLYFSCDYLLNYTCDKAMTRPYPSITVELLRILNRTSTFIVYSKIYILIRLLNNLMYYKL